MDTSRWPLVVATHQGEPPDVEVDQFIRLASGLFARQTRFAIVFDSQTVTKVSAHMRKQTTEFLKAHQHELARYIVCQGMVFHSAALRLIFSGMLAFLESPVPYRICSTVPEATEWARSQLRLEGL